MDAVINATGTPDANVLPDATADQSPATSQSAPATGVNTLLDAGSANINAHRDQLVDTGRNAIPSDGPNVFQTAMEKAKDAINTPRLTIPEGPNFLDRQRQEAAERRAQFEAGLETQKMAHPYALTLNEMKILASNAGYKNAPDDRFLAAMQRASIVGGKLVNSKGTDEFPGGGYTPEQAAKIADQMMKNDPELKQITQSANTVAQNFDRNYGNNSKIGTGLRKFSNVVMGGGLGFGVGTVAALVAGAAALIAWPITALFSNGLKMLTGGKLDLTKAVNPLAVGALVGTAAGVASFAGLTKVSVNQIDNFAQTTGHAKKT